MRVCIGLLLSPQFAVPNDFWLGRPGAVVDPHAPTGTAKQTEEGLLALVQRIQTGAINRILPEDSQITSFRMIVSRKFPTDVARNEVCASFLQTGEDALLFLDADMVHPSDLLERLVLADKPVITARYHVKKAPFGACVYVKHPSEEGEHRYAAVHYGRGVFEIERAGAGALLIKREVVQAIYDAHGHNWFRYQRAPDPPHDYEVSEDFWFFKVARQLGFKCYVDWDLECLHCQPMHVDQTWNEPFLTAQIGQFNNPDHRDAILKNTIILGYPDGLILDDETSIPEYRITEGER